MNTTTVRLTCTSSPQPRLRGGFVDKVMGVAFPFVDLLGRLDVGTGLMNDKGRETRARGKTRKRQMDLQ